MRILLIYDYIPYPPSSGAPIRNYNLLKRLAREHEVWIVAFARKEQDAENIAHLQEFCAGVETVEKPSSRPLDRPWLALQYIIRGWPFELRHKYSPQMTEIIRTLVTKLDFDVVEIANSIMGLYLEALPTKLRNKSLVTCHDAIFSKEERITRLEPRLARKLRTWLNGRMLRNWEPYYLEGFARCIAVSKVDQDLLRTYNPRLKIDVVPNGIDTKKFQLLPWLNIKPSLLFVGNMEYRPNIDAVCYFCDQILPLIRAKIPETEVYIIGINPAPEVRALAGYGVHVTGMVEDVRPYYERSAVCIVPLRAGGGTRLKILEAMALGRPVVSTSIGCEGLDVQNGKHLFIADTPVEFAEKTMQLLNERNTRDYIIRCGRELAEQRYDWDVLTNQLLKSYAEVTQ